MSETKHTPEPWEVREVDGLVAICHKTGWVLENDNDEQNKTDARRIVACVNACAGIDIKFLEDFSILHEIKESKERREKAESQRDELLAALKGLLDPENDSDESYRVAYDAIRKIENA